MFQVGGDREGGHPRHREEVGGGARLRPGLGEVAGLAAELVRLRAADGDGDRRRRWRPEADRTVAYRRLGIEPNDVADRGEKQPRARADAANGDAALAKTAPVAARAVKDGVRRKGGGVS